MNRVIIKGNLVADPDVKTVGGDNKSLTSFRLASNPPKGKTVYIDVQTWNVLADNCGKYLSKGSSVLVDGRISYDTFQTSKGETASKTYITAENVEFLNTGGVDHAETASKKETETDEVPF
jgi:single-strand DNA-binding protein